MKTLAEIEAAVESLQKDKQEQLLRFIEAHLRKGASVLGRRLGPKQRFPISKGRVPFTSADVIRIESESDAT